MGATMRAMTIADAKAGTRAARHESFLQLWPIVFVSALNPVPGVNSEKFQAPSRDHQHEWRVQLQQ